MFGFDDNMPRCSHCHELLTRFDRYYNKILFPHERMEHSCCFRCRTSNTDDNNKVYNAFKSAESKYDCIKWHILGFVLLIATSILVNLIESYILNYYKSIDITYSLVPGLISIILNLIVFIPQWYCGYQVVRHFFRDKITPSEYAGTRKEGTARVRDDKIEINFEEVTEYSGGDQRPWFLMLILILFFHGWNIPYLIYFWLNTRRKLYKICPKEAVDAWFTARKKVKRIVVDTRYINQYQEYSEQNKKNKNKIINKFAMFGMDRANQELFDFHQKVVRFSINKTMYILADYRQSYYNKTPEKYFLLRMNKENRIVGIVVIDGYEVYNEYDWMYVWKVAGGNEEVLKNIQSYIISLNA